MTASLTVLSGPLAGTRLDLDEIHEEILVGSDPDCRLALDVPGVSPIHARLSREDGGLKIYDTRSPRGLFLNDDRVDGEAVLRDKDVIWLGPPGDPESVMLQCRLKEPTGEFPAMAPEPPAPASSADVEAIVLDEPPAVADAAPVLVDEPPMFGDEPPAFSVEPPAPEPEAFVVPEPPLVPAAPVAAAAEPASEDMFFMEEPAAPPPPAPPPPPPAPPVAAAPAADESLFFVEDSAPVAAAAPPPAAAAPPAAARPAPAPAPARSAPTAAPTPAAPAAASTARPGRPSAPAASSGGMIAPPKPAPGATRPARRPGPTPPPSAALESDDAPAPRPPRSAAPRPAPAAARRGSRPPVGLIAGGAALVLLAAVAGVVVMRSAGTPSITAVTPPRVGLGQSVTITGTHFAAAATDNAVTFGGKPGRVVQASATSLQVEIPEVEAPAGRDTPVPVVVSVAGHESKPATVAVFQAPRIHGISPTVAMPGDEVVLAGAGWGAGAKVEFGSVAATVVETAPTSIKVTVPALEGAPGTEFPVRVSMGADTSNPAPFLVGRLPLLLAVTPASAAPGDVVTLAGRGFDAKPSAIAVKVGGARALVAAATSAELKVVVPRVAAGESAVEVRVPGNENVGQAKLAVAAGADPIDFHFVAEPFEDQPGHDHAVLSTGLGPAFVVSGSGGRSAAERALEAEKRLNDAGPVLKSSIDVDVRAKGLDGSPSLVLIGRDTPLVDVTAEDAAAYDEDWTGLKGRGGSVSPARLAAWWEAVARDLVLLLARGDAPHFAADLAPEGKVLADLNAPARKSVTSGVPQQVIAEAKPAVREALRTVGFRVPAAVKGPASAVAAATPTSAEPAPAAGPALKLDGNWSGTETESGALKYITASFSGASGSLTYQRALTITVPVREVVQQKGTVHFLVNTGSGPRYYQAKWDGQKLSGTLSADPAGKSPVGTFELSPG